MNQGTEIGEKITSVATGVDREVLKAVSRFAFWIALMTVVASVLLVSTRRFCTASQCFVAQMNASPLLYLIIAAIAVMALTFARESANRESYLRALRRTTIAIGAILVVAVATSQVWLHSLPMENFDALGVNVVSPILFSHIQVMTIAT